MARIGPPRLARALLRSVAPPGPRFAELVAELDEEHGACDRPDRWYWSQVLRSAPHLLAYRLESPSRAALSRACLEGGLLFFGLFCAGTAGLVALFSLLPAPPQIRLAAYLAALFIAAAAGARWGARKLADLDPLPVAAAVGALSAGLIAVMMWVSPEVETPVAWLVWSSFAVGGTLAGSKRPTPCE